MPIGTPAIAPNSRPPGPFSAVAGADIPVAMTAPIATALTRNLFERRTDMRAS